MWIKCEVDIANRCYRFSGEVSFDALGDLDFDRLDRLQLSTPPKTGADILLDLERIFRRHEVQNASQASNEGASER